MNANTNRPYIARYTGRKSTFSQVLSLLAMATTVACIAVRLTSGMAGTQDDGVGRDR